MLFALKTETGVLVFNADDGGNARRFSTWLTRRRRTPRHADAAEQERWHHAKTSAVRQGRLLSSWRPDENVFVVTI